MRGQRDQQGQCHHPQPTLARRKSLSAPPGGILPCLPNLCTSAWPWFLSKLCWLISCGSRKDLKAAGRSVLWQPRSAVQPAGKSLPLNADQPWPLCCRNNHDNSNKSQATSRYQQIPHSAQGPHCACERVPRWEHASGMRQSPRLTARECERPSHGEGPRQGTPLSFISPARAAERWLHWQGCSHPPGPEEPREGGRLHPQLSPQSWVRQGQAQPSCRRSLHNGISVLVPDSPARAQKQVHKQVLLISPAREILAPTGMQHS